MHETGIAKDLLQEAARVAAGQRVVAMRLEVGAMSGISAQHLRETIEREAQQRWDETPRVEVTIVEEPLAPDAMSVRLATVTV